jgi:hypothetical protein
MTTEDGEILSSFIDREPVDPDALARLLENPQGRRTLVEFASVRRALQAPAPGEGEWLASRSRAASRPRATYPRWRLAAAAALLIGSTALGALAERSRSRERPPEPTRVVQLEPLAGINAPR